MLRSDHGKYACSLLIWNYEYIFSKLQGTLKFTNRNLRRVRFNFLSLFFLLPFWFSLSFPSSRISESFSHAQILRSFILQIWCSVVICFYSNLFFKYLEHSILILVLWHNVRQFSFLNMKVFWLWNFSHMISGTHGDYFAAWLAGPSSCCAISSSIKQMVE